MQTVRLTQGRIKSFDPEWMGGNSRRGPGGFRFLGQLAGRKPVQAFPSKARSRAYR